MSVRSLSLLIAALPLALALPQYDEAYNCIREPCSTSTSTNPVVTAAPTPSPAAAGESSTDNVDLAADDDVKAQFAASTTYDFGETATFPADFWQATDHIGGSPYSHTFSRDNIKVEDGFLVLTNRRFDAGTGDLSSAEVSTLFNVTGGSVRTWAILTEEPGVVDGIFFYASDCQETDIEWISDPTAQSNEFANNGTRALQYTNQALNCNRDDASSKFAKAPEDATSAVHEYRIDWFADRVDYYTDSVYQHTIDTNVPNVEGPWVWNIWGDGNVEWTDDPPKNDAVFKIQKIEMYYNPA